MVSCSCIHNLGNCKGDDILFWPLSFFYMLCAKTSSKNRPWSRHDVIIREFVSFITQGWGRKKMSQTNLTILASQLGFLEVLIIPGNCKRSPAPGAIWASEKSLRTSFLIWNQSGLHLLQELREQELMAVPGSSWVGLYRLRLSGRRVCSRSGGFSHSRWHVTRRYGVSNAASSLGCCVFDNVVLGFLLKASEPSNMASLVSLYSMVMIMLRMMSNALWWISAGFNCTFVCCVWKDIIVI